MRQIQQRTTDQYGAQIAWGLLTFLSIVGYCLVWIWQGIDIAEEGYHLTTHMLIARGDASYMYGTSWLSDWVGGRWLSITGDPGLVAARMGWALSFALTGLATYAVLSSTFSPWSAASVTLVTAVAINYRAVMVMSCDCTAMLILVPACGIVWASQRPDWGRRVRMLAALTAGVLLALGAMAKFSLVLGLAVPLIPLLVLWWCQRPVRPVAARIAVTTWCGALVAGILCLLWLRVSGNLEDYLRMFTGEVAAALSYEHAGSTVGRISAESFIQSAEHTVGLISVVTVLTVVLRLLLARWNLSKLAPVALAAMMILLVPFLRQIYGLTGTLNIYRLVLPGTAFALGLFCVFVEIYCLSPARRSFDVLCLLTLGSCLPLLIFIGSPNGFMHMYHGLWLLLPVGLLVLDRSITVLLAATVSQPVPATWYRPYLIVFGLFMFLLMPVGIRVINANRDLPNRFDLTTELAHPRLQYIHTFQKRADSLDEMLRQVELRVRVGDDLLAVNESPMIYYATCTVPVCGWSAPSSFNHAMQIACAEDLKRLSSLPKIAVRTKTNPQIRYWGARSVPLNAKIFNKLNQLDAALKELGYREIWSNNDFLVMERSTTDMEAVDVSAQQGDGM